MEPCTKGVHGISILICFWIFQSKQSEQSSLVLTCLIMCKFLLKIGTKREREKRERECIHVCVGVGLREMETEKRNIGRSDTVKLTLVVVLKTDYVF